MIAGCVEYISIGKQQRIKIDTSVYIKSQIKIKCLQIGFNKDLTEVDLEINLKFEPDISKINSLLPYQSTKLKSALPKGYYSRLNFSPYIVSGAYKSLTIED